MKIIANNIDLRSNFHVGTNFHAENVLFPNLQSARIALLLRVVKRY